MEVDNDAVAADHSSFGFDADFWAQPDFGECDILIEVECDINRGLRRPQPIYVEMYLE